ncbi:MAG: selenocysteine-specific translation elongation factor [Bacillota bacterium]|nr:selenocysteine-specific translation elongation factor [Bacillota bacterium]
MGADSHIIVGTAGHVDHGKTELVARLTGINTDRLPEEKKRGMTIVPGFVPLILPDGQRLGLIDVPGHERFVKNMLAGVAGIDMVMLVIAADEGVMPQTREHLHILHLLDVSRGVVVITKSDLVDGEWLDMVREQAAELIAATSLKDAPIIAVSSISGQGIEELRQILQQLAAQVEQKPASGHFRLPIDRVFTKSGFGTVITGTLWTGVITDGERVQLWPSGAEARVRGLQVHGDKVGQAYAGQRTAVNLSGTEAELAPRGGWLAAPGLLKESYRLDVALRLLAEGKPLQQRARLRVHHGTAEALARVNLLDREELAGGESCFAQLELEAPLPPLRGDRLVLRSYSPMLTIGGATVIDANPRKHRRFDKGELETLAALAGADRGGQLLAVALRQKAPLNAAALAEQAQLPLAEISGALPGLCADGSLLSLEVDGVSYYFSAEKAEQRLAAVQRLLADYHRKYPLRSGVTTAELRSRALDGWSVKQLNALLALWQQRGCIRVNGQTAAAADFIPQPDAAQRQLLDKLLAAYQQSPFAPPETAEVVAALRLPAEQLSELLGWLVEQEQLVKTGELYFAATAVQRALELLRAREDDSFTLAEFRDALDSSRKYVLPLLEYFDAAGITRRVGDKRIISGK